MFCSEYCNYTRLLSYMQQGILYKLCRGILCKSNNVVVTTICLDISRNLCYTNVNQFRKDIPTMTSILTQKIQNAKLTKTQEKIARYFIRNQQRIGNLSSIEVAREIGVSDASIIRFSRSIGYEGFADLKADLYNSLVESAYSAMSLNERMSQSKQQFPDKDMGNQFLDLMQNNLSATFRQNDAEKYKQAADMIVSARKRYTIGLRGCRGVAMQFCRLLSFMLPNAVCLQDTECTSINAMQDAGPEDVVVMFSFARYYKMDVNYLSMARERGVKIVLISDEMVSPLVGYADLVLFAETEHMSFFNSTLGAAFIGEYLLTLISRMVDFQSRMQQRDEITKDQRLS